VSFGGVPAQRHGAAVAVVALVDQPGLAQHAEVVGAGGLADRKVEGAAWAFVRCGRGREELLLSFVEPTRREPGSLQYQVHRDIADPTSLVFYELWRSAEDLRRHLAVPELARFGEARMDYLREDLEIHWLSPLSVNALNG
jgi:quinol monooxygenase YgiN